MAGSSEPTAISQYLWEMLITSVPPADLQKLSKEYERINLIKESIYLQQCYHKRKFPFESTAADRETMFNLHARLDDDLQPCRPYVEKILGLPVL